LLLAEHILKSGGCLISEFEPNFHATLWSFTKRNRLMAGISKAVLIIEAEEKSGTLITARQALELGRDIGAVPGDIFSNTSRGPLNLIHDGATPITSPDDLRELLGLPEKNREIRGALQLNEEEKTIMDLLNEPKEKDLLLEESQLPLTDFLTTITTLEMKGYIEETFGEVRKIV
jgi:DNA processing protein